MKNIVFLFLCQYLFTSAMAQISTLSIATNKTSSLVFPYSIRHVDRGTKDVLVQQVKEADNILLIKASEKNFLETNLSVVTDDGNIYTFIVNYSEHPISWIYHLPENKKAVIATHAQALLDNPRILSGIKSSKWQMFLRVAGIYIKDNKVFYHLQLQNQSPIDYDIDLVKFYIRDIKKSKRTAIQENELKPIFVAGNTTQVRANCTSAIVLVFDKFTIPDAKYLAVELVEKNGGRNLSMKISNNKIMQAIALPDLR